MILKLKSKTYGHFNVLIDGEDYERVKQYSWSINTPMRGRLYVRSSHHVLLHRFIMDAPEGKEVDHINGNLLDNRKKNLRVCERCDNVKNRATNKNSSSGFRGVYWDAETCKWCAAISFNKTRRKLGRYETKEQAARAYNNAAKKYHGEFARLNEIKEVVE